MQSMFAARLRTYCGGHSIGDEMHTVFERSAIQSLKASHANHPMPDTVPRWFTQEDRFKVFQSVLDCLDLL